MNPRSDPAKLPPPKNELERLRARFEAETQLELIDERLKELRRRRRQWNTRLGVCLRISEPHGNGHAKVKVGA